MITHSGKWSVRRHPNKSKRWAKEKYFHRIDGRDWRFMEKKNPEPLILLGKIPIRRYVKIKAEFNPYDNIWKNYLNKRLVRKYS